MYGTPEKNGFINLTCFKLPVDRVKEHSHKYNVTVTVFMSAVLTQALINLQKEKVPADKLMPIKVLIPINLRQLFPSKTVRNFSMYTVPEVDPRLGDYTFEEICDIIRFKMGMEFTAKHMSTVIATNVHDESNPLVRLIPLPIKNAVMKAIFNNVGEKKSCMNLSNMGKVNLPQIMDDYIQRFDFILGVQASAPYNSSMCSYKYTVYFNFIRDIQEPELEKHFHAILKQFEIPATVESNKNER